MALLNSHELDQNRCHIVAARLLGGLPCQQRIQQVLQYLLSVTSRLALVAYSGHHGLAVVDIFLPNSIAA